MKNVYRVAYVPYHAHQMYDLVNDIQRYPEFIVGCTDAEILSQQEYEIRARLSFSKLGFQKGFTTLNRLSPGKMIDLRLLDGPFRHLEGYWLFEDLGEQGCKITFSLDFEFSNYLMEKAFGPIFSSIADSFIQAFVVRARKIYS